MHLFFNKSPNLKTFSPFPPRNKSSVHGSSPSKVDDDIVDLDASNGVNSDDEEEEEEQEEPSMPAPNHQGANVPDLSAASQF